MNPKVRVALALSLLLMLVSTVAVDAGRSSSVSVKSWTYAPIADGSSTFDLTSSVDISGIRKYKLEIHVAPVNAGCAYESDPGCGDIYAYVDASGRKAPYTTMWRSSVDGAQTEYPYLIPGVQYAFRYYLYDSTKPGYPAVAYSDSHVFVAGTMESWTAP